MVLGKLPVPGRPTLCITVGQGPTALAVGAGGGCLDIFTLIYPFSPLSPSLWETARYRLKYCLKGPLNPKQPTNQFTTKHDSKRVFWHFYEYINRLYILEVTTLYMYIRALSSEICLNRFCIQLIKTGTVWLEETRA